MQETTALYKQIVGSGYYETETMIKIQDTSGVMIEFGEGSILDVSISRGAFNGSNLAIGSAPIASCSITLVSNDFSAKEISRNIPKSARIEIYERVTDGYSVSEWLLQGVFFGLTLWCWLTLVSPDRVKAGPRVESLTRT